MFHGAVQSKEISLLLFCVVFGSKMSRRLYIRVLLGNVGIRSRLQRWFFRVQLWLFYFVFVAVLVSLLSN